MWRPATREVSGTNDSTWSTQIFCFPRHQVANKPLRLAPLGNRRRFGPAPVESNTPPQLAQPSPTTFSKPYGSDNPTKSREESPTTPTPGKWNTFTTPSPARERFLVHRGVLGEISLQRVICLSFLPPPSSRAVYSSILTITNHDLRDPHFLSHRSS